MLISEIFESIQGEGPWAGAETLFIRTSGCNLRCWFCDTPYTSWRAEGEQKSVDELMEVVERSPCPHVVLTGGEPMLVPDIAELSRRCRQLGRVVTIETAGTVDQPVECDLMAISPKLSNSTPADAVWSVRHEKTRHQPEVIQQLWARYHSILKFVIDSPADLEEVERYLPAFPEITPEDVWLMPQARDREQLNEKTGWIREAAEACGYRFSSRLHIELFGDRRGT